MMFTVATIALILGMVLGLYRAIKGPTLYDRILAGNMIGTLTVLLLAVHGFLAGRPEFLDIALVYALINFIGTIAILKYFRFKDLGHSEDPQPQKNSEQENM